MQELEKMLEEIDRCDMFEDGLFMKVQDVKDIIRKHMNGLKCGECSRRKWYQKGYEDGKNSNDGWIPVEERLPETDSTERYIITDTGGCVWTEMWYGYAEEADNAPCFYKWDDEMWQCFKMDAIAWMPIPKPYNPEK